VNATIPLEKKKKRGGEHRAVKEGGEVKIRSLGKNEANLLIRFDYGEGGGKNNCGNDRKKARNYNKKKGRGTRLTTEGLNFPSCRTDEKKMRWGKKKKRDLRVND